MNKSVLSISKLVDVERENPVVLPPSPLAPVLHTKQHSIPRVLELRLLHRERNTKYSKKEFSQHTLNDFSVYIHMIPKSNKYSHDSVLPGSSKMPWT